MPTASTKKPRLTRRAWDFVRKVVRGVWDVVSARVRGAWDFVCAHVRSGWDFAGKCVGSAWDFGRARVRSAYGLVRVRISSAWNFARTLIRRHPLRASIIAGTVFVIAVVWYFGHAYWSTHQSMSWQECVYGEFGCSTAAATWALAAFGVFTFLAAYRAVFWAKQAFAIEIAPRLGQSVCTHGEEDDHTADKMIFLTGDGHILFRKPALLTPEALKKEYVSHPNAFENLGRSALSDIHVDMYVRDADGEMNGPYDVMVGNIKCDKEVHLVVYVSTVFKPVEIMWAKATERGNKIEFFAESALERSVEVALKPPAEQGTLHEQIRLPLVEAPKPNGVTEASFQPQPPNAT